MNKTIDKVLLASLLLGLTGACWPGDLSSAESAATLTLDVAQATGPVVVAPLFDYPQAPDDIDGLGERADWLMDHFWDPMDFKTRKAVDQAALNHAFGVYVAPMQWASKAKVDKSVAKLADRLRRNPQLLVQFTQAAEENLYGPRAEVWIDEVYRRFLESALSSKKLPEKLRGRWSRQLAAMRASATGEHAPSFKFASPDGAEKEYFAMSTPTLLVFGRSSDPDLRMELMRANTDTRLSKAVESGNLNVVFIDVLPDGASASPASAFSVLPSRWVGGSAGGDSLPFDLRSLPVCYPVDSDGRISGRFHSLRSALAEIRPGK